MTRTGPWLRRSASALTGVLLVGAGLVTPAAATADVDFAVACPDIAGSAGTPTDCVPLTDAINEVMADNSVSAGAATIVLLPGEYCPFTLPFGYRQLTIQGAGLAGYSDGGSGESSLGGYEAQLSTIGNFGTCPDSGSPPTSLVTFTAQSQSSDYDWYPADSSVSFVNLTLQGPGAGTGSQDGIDFTGGYLDLRDDLVTGFPGYGVKYFGGASSSTQDGANVLQSAFTHNGVGALLSGYSGIDDSTFTQNATGLVPEGDDSSINDTVAGNTVGVAISGFGYSNAVNDTIVAGNTTDCQGTTSDWESASSYNAHNLDGPTCHNNASGTSTDVAYDSSQGAIGSVQTTGLTPWISPPGQAVGAGDTCLSKDQLESIVTDIHDCDIGAVEVTGANSTPGLADNDSGAIDFGTVPEGVTQQQTDRLYNLGGGLVGVSGVTSDSSDFAVSLDDCTLRLLVDAAVGNGCYVAVTFAPSSQSAESGHLTIQTTAGPVVVDLSGTGGSPVTAPTAPQHVTGTPSSHSVALTWQPPASDGGSPIAYSEVRYVPHGQSDWQYASTNGASTSYDVTGLTDGTAYDFEVSAATQYFNYATTPSGSPWSDPATVTAGTAQRSALSTPKAPKVAYGATAELRTKLTDTANSAALTGESVVLLARGKDGFVQQSAATTNGAGQATFAVRVPRTTSYEFRFDGAFGHRPVTSSPFTLAVDQVVHAASTATSVRHGHAVKVYGTVAPDAPGQRVVLQRQTGHRWVAVATTQLRRQRLPNGKVTDGFVIAYRPKGSGEQHLRVTSPATAANGVGLSTGLALNVT